MQITREAVVSNLRLIEEAIAAAARRSGRLPQDVLVVAAAKTVSPALVRWAVEGGVRAVGENYVRELRSKQKEVPGVSWHYIGTLQSSTAHYVADLSDVVETVSGERAARRLAGRASRGSRVVDALIEVDLAGRGTGVRPEDLDAFTDLIASLRGLRLRGLMTLPPFLGDPQAARPYFEQLRELRERLRSNHPEVLDLSMGMSLDYEVAVEEGATMVRIGTALFGPRGVPDRSA
jgi:hypothetical protein